MIKIGDFQVLESTSTVNILLVDDREDNLLSLNAVLRSPEYLLVNATSGAQALECLAARDFAVILLDVQMPGMDGMETARRIRRMERSANTPIILVTGLFPDEKHIRLGYEVGAVDFVSKPFDPRIMKSKVAVFAELYRKTEKIREQEKLLHEAAESRFKTLFEQSPLGIRLYAPTGECVLANRAWDRMWGNLAPELRAINLKQEPERMPTSDAVVKALNGEPSELPPLQFHGRWIKSYAYPIRNDQGAIREAAVIIQDVSEQKRADEELRSSRDQLRIILERVADGVVVHDRQFRAVYANDVGAKLLGFESVEALLIEGTVFNTPGNRFDIFGQDGRPVDFDSVPTKLAIRGEHPGPETISRFKDRETGNERWLVVSSRPVLDDQGKPYLAVTIYREITEQVRSAQRDRFLSKATAILASSLDYKASLQEIAELATDEIADWCRIALADEQEHFLQTVAVSNVDPRLAPISGLAIEPGYVPNPSDLHGSLKVMATGESFMLGEVHDKDTRAMSVDDEQFNRLKGLGIRSVIVSPIRARSEILGTVAIAYAAKGRSYDESDLLLCEELGRRIGMAIENAKLYFDAQAQREGLQKAVQAREEFISIASHELKTPVTSLILHAEMAALQLERNEPIGELRERFGKYLAISTSQIDRLSRLIEEMLDVSRISHGKLSMEMESVDLARLAREVIEDFSEQLTESGSSFEFHESGEALVRCDRYRLEQVITNLLTNAMKYGQSKPIRVAVSGEGDEVRMSFRDEGIGIAPEHHARIFDRFERAVSATHVSGLGLGLYIVKKIVEAHDGKVEVRSELGQGSEFVVTLKRASPPKTKADTSS